MDGLKKIDSKVFFLLVSLVLTGMVMKMLGPAEKLDSRFYYTAAEASRYLEGLSLMEQRSYLYGELIDLWFLVNYSWLLYLGLKRIRPQLRYLSIIPGLLDFIETSAILMFLTKEQTFISLSSLSIVSGLKWSSAIAVLSFLLIQFIRLKLK